MFYPTAPATLTPFTWHPFLADLNATPRICNPPLQTMNTELLPIMAKLSQHKERNLKQDEMMLSLLNSFARQNPAKNALLRQLSDRSSTSLTKQELINIILQDQAEIQKCMLLWQQVVLNRKKQQIIDRMWNNTLAGIPLTANVIDRIQEQQMSEFDDMLMPLKASIDPAGMNLQTEYQEESYEPAPQTLENCLILLDALNRAQQASLVPNNPKHKRRKSIPGLLPRSSSSASSASHNL